MCVLGINIIICSLEWGRLKYVRLVGTARRKGVCSSVKPCVMILQVSK